MSNSSRRLIVIIKRRPWDDATWKRILLSYAYALYDQRKKEDQRTADVSEVAQG